MSSSSSIWHIATLEPDTSQTQNLQDAYLPDPSRYLPDLQSGFRVYGHARKHVPPDPSYFYIDDAMREQSFGTIHPDNKDWVIAYESENFGQTRILDIASTRKMRTTMDGMPLGAIRPEGEVAGQWQEEEPGGPNKGMKWSDVKDYTSEQMINNSNRQSSTLNNVLPGLNAPGSGVPPPPPTPSPPAGGSGGRVPPSPPTPFSGGGSGVVTSKNLSAYYDSLDITTPQRLSDFSDENMAALLSENNLSDSDQKEFMQEYEDYYMTNYANIPGDEIFLSFIRDYNHPTYGNLGEMISKTAIQQRLDSIGLQDNDIRDELTAYFVNPKSVSQKTVDYVAAQMQSNLTPQEQVAWLQFDFNNQTLVDSFNTQIERFKYKSLGDPFQVVSTVSTLPGSSLPVPVLNDPSTIQQLTQSGVQASASPSIDALKQLPLDALVIEKYLQKKKSLQEVVTLQPGRSLTTIALDIRDVIEVDPKLGNLLSASYKKMYNQDYTEQLMRIGLPSLTDNDLNILMADPEIVGAMKKVLTSAGVTTRPESSLILDVLQTLPHYANLPENLRNTLFIPWEHMVSLLKQPIDGVNWSNDSRVKPFIDASMNFENFKPTDAFGFMTIDDARKVMPRIVSSPLSEADFKIAEILGINYSFGSTSAELYYLTAMNMIDITTSEGYETYVKVLKKTLGWYDIVYHKSSNGMAFSPALNIVEAYFTKITDALISNSMTTESATKAMNDVMVLLTNITLQDRKKFEPFYNNIRSRIANLETRRVPFNNATANVEYDKRSSKAMNELVHDLRIFGRQIFMGDIIAPFFVNRTSTNDDTRTVNNIATSIMAGFGDDYTRVKQIPIVDYQTAPINDVDSSPESLAYANSVMKKIQEIAEQKDSPRYYTGVKKATDIMYNTWLSGNQVLHDPENWRKINLGYHGVAGIAQIWGFANGIVQEAKVQKALPELTASAEKQFAESVDTSLLTQEIKDEMDNSSYMSMAGTAVPATLSVVGKHISQMVGSSLDRLVLKARADNAALFQAGAGVVGASKNWYWFHSAAVGYAVSAATSYASYANALAASAPFVFGGAMIAVSANQLIYTLVANRAKNKSSQNVSVLQSMTEYFLELGEIEAQFTTTVGMAAIKTGSSIARVAASGGKNLLLKLIGESKDDSPEGLKNAARRNLIGKIGELTESQIDVLEKVFTDSWAQISLVKDKIEVEEGKSIDEFNTPSLVDSLNNGGGAYKLSHDLQFTPGMEEKKGALRAFALQAANEGVMISHTVPNLRTNLQAKRDTVIPIISMTVDRVAAAFPQLAATDPTYAIGLYFQKNIREIWAISLILSSMNDNPEYQLIMMKAVDNIFTDPAQIGRLLQDSIRTSKVTSK